MDIRGALSKLDPENDEHWTGDALPSMEALKAMGLKNVSRGQITRAAPGFTRFNRTLEEEGEDQPDAGDAAPPPPPTNDLQMESSDFGGAGPTEEPPPPPPAPTEEELQAQLDAANAAVAKAQLAVSEAKRAEEAAQKLRDATLERMSRPVTPQENQKIIMDFLAASVPAPKPVDTSNLSALDKSFQKPQGYGKQAANYPVLK